MKLIDKLKNVFFEEVPDEEDEEELPQTFAKKIEVPKKHIEPVKISREESKPIVTLEEEKENELKEELDVKEEFEDTPEPTKKEESSFPMMFDDDDFLEDKKQKEMDDTLSRTSLHSEDDNDLNHNHELYQGKKELSYIESVRKPNYSYTKSYYEEKETKEFKPSPIISPVYGILDKNYRKEEVVTKKETRVSSSSNSRFDLDSIRNKAFGADDEMISDKKTREAKEEKEEKKIYDVNNNKPQVNHVTLADADEYYNDLGLAYNVDYSDASRSSTSSTRSSKYSPKEKRKDKNIDENLFDLIDSMYKEDE